jgi:hypothetical protein
VDTLKRLLHFQEVFNRHDLAAVLDLYHPEVRYEQVDDWVRHGREAVAEVEAWNRVVNCQLKFFAPVVRGETVTARAQETSEWLRLAGITAVHYDSLRYTFRDGLIVDVRAVLAQETWEAVARAMNRILPWARENHPEQLERLMPGGEFLYSAESAAGWLELLRALREDEPAAG